MLKKTITYEDFNGETRSEDFFFNISKQELITMELVEKNGLASYLKAIVDSKDGKAIMDKFNEIIMMSVGQKSEDGRRFIKNQDVRDEFASTGAYEALFMELVTDAAAAATFIKAILPQNLDLNVSTTPSVAAVPDLPIPPAGIQHVEPKDPSEMTREELIEAFRNKTIPPAN